MSTAKKSKRTPAKKKPASSSLVWFEIPADDVARARKFYSALFGWKINPLPGAAVSDYWHIDTGGADATPDGGLMKRKCPEQSTIQYLSVASVAKAAAKVQKLGGSVCLNKTAVAGMGYFVICQDTEKNTFALWEMNENAK